MTEAPNLTASAIVLAARACLRTPFRHQGRIPGVALDCAGLVLHALRAAGANCLDVPAYGRNPSHGMLEDAIEANTCVDRVLPGDRQAGDVLLMRFAAEPQHLAICAGETIIHAYQSVGMVCEHRLADVWASRIVRVYRVRSAP